MACVRWWMDWEAQRSSSQGCGRLLRTGLPGRPKPSWSQAAYGVCIDMGSQVEHTKRAISFHQEYFIPCVTFFFIPKHFYSWQARFSFLILWYELGVILLISLELLWFHDNVIEEWSSVINSALVETEQLPVVLGHAAQKTSSDLRSQPEYYIIHAGMDISSSLSSGLLIKVLSFLCAW